MNATVTMEQLSAMHGAPVYDASGDKIGSVEEIFYDEDTREPEWIGIGVGFFGTKRVLVPVEGARIDGDVISVSYEKGVVKDSPDIDGDEISEATERDLYDYYGLQRFDAGASGDAGFAGRAVGEREPEQAEGSVTRSEEELRVGKREVEAGTVRLRKWVATEPVEATVELRRERLRVDREPIDEPVQGHELSEEDVEVTLHREEPVVEKQTVGKERVSLSKDVDARTETVSDELRKERVEVEGDTDAGASDSPRR
jgi:uncharacterized protein (TIGR02271 family)